MTNITNNLENLLSANLMICYPQYNVYAQKAINDICDYFENMRTADESFQYVVHTEITPDETQGACVICWVEDGNLKSYVFDFYTVIHPKSIELGKADI